MDTTPAATAWPHPTDLPAIHAWATEHRADPAAVRRWAAPLLTAARRAGPIPLLGSPAWRALPPDDPRTLGAAARAALAELAERTPDAIAGRLRAELDEFATGVRRMFAEAHDDVRQARIDLGYRTGPSYAEIVRRRRLTSSAPCGACGAPVTLVHPLPAEHAEQLPDMSWVRCRSCRSRVREVSAA